MVGNEWAKGGLRVDKMLPVVAGGQPTIFGGRYGGQIVGGPPTARGGKELQNVGQMVEKGWEKIPLVVASGPPSSKGL